MTMMVMMMVMMVVVVVAEDVHDYDNYDNYDDYNGNDCGDYGVYFNDIIEDVYLFYFSFWINCQQTTLQTSTFYRIFFFSDL